MSRRIIFHVLMLAMVCTGSITGTCRAATNHIRELAKNKPKVFIVVSGPQAVVIGHTLQNAILKHSDNRHGAEDVILLTVAQAAAQAGSEEFGKSPVVFLLIGKEMTGALPSALTGILPFPLSDPAEKVSSIASTLSGNKRQQVFTVGMFAPDIERLQRLYSIFSAHESENYRSLPFQDNYRSNRLALFSASGSRSVLDTWGTSRDSHVWDDIVWHDLTEGNRMTPEQLEERTQVYFFNRARNDAVPSVAASIITSHALKPTTIIIEGQALASGQSVVVFSAPSRMILEKKAHHYPTLASLAGVPAVDEAVDLRTVKQTTLLMSGSIPEADREQVRLLLAKDIRQALGIEVEERGPVLQVLQREVTLEQLQGASDTSRLLRRKSGLRYVWHFGVADYSGTTQYEPQETCMTPAPPPYSIAEPGEPGRGGGLFGGHKKSDDEYNRDMNQFREDHSAWEQKKTEYDARGQNAYYQWNQQINSRSAAHVQGVLTLFDMQSSSGGKVIWQHDCSGDDEQNGVLRTQHESVRGIDNRPSSLEVPAASETCSLDLLHAAVRQASRSVFESLQETALLPSAGAYLPDAASAAPSAETSRTLPPTVTAALVAGIQDGIITLNVGATQGLHTGSLVTIPLKTRQITDPVTGAVLDTRVIDRIVLRVSECHRLADCVPATPQDSAKMSQVTVGMSVQWVVSAPTRKVHRN